MKVKHAILATLAGILIAGGVAIGASSGTNRLQAALLELFCDACGQVQATNVRDLVASTVTLQDSQNVTGSKFFTGTNTVFGSTSAQNVSGGVSPQVQVHGTSAATARTSVTRWTNGAGVAANYNCANSRGATIGTHAISLALDPLCQFISMGDDGTNFQNSSSIVMSVDNGTVSATSMPGKICLNTAPNNSVTLTAGLCVDMNQNVSVTNGVLLTTAPNTQTGATYTVAATDNYIIQNGGQTLTLTFPSASANTGRAITVKSTAAFTTVSAASNVVPCIGGSAGTAILAATAGKFATLVSDATNWVIMACN